jgi:hypothetical protein
MDEVKKEEKTFDSKKADRQVATLILLFVLLFGLFIGIYYYNQKVKYGPYAFDYNGYEVIYLDQGNGPIYKLKVFLRGSVEASYINLRRDPRDIDDISIKVNKEDVLAKFRLYITMHPTNLTSTSVLAGAEISKITGNQYLYGIPTTGAVILPVEGKVVDIRTCNDVTNEVGIILLQLGSENKVYSDENGCVIVQGITEENLIDGANLLDLYLLGVIK